MTRKKDEEHSRTKRMQTKHFHFVFLNHFFSKFKETYLARLANAFLRPSCSSSLELVAPESPIASDLCIFGT